VALASSSLQKIDLDIFPFHIVKHLALSSVGHGRLAPKYHVISPLAQVGLARDLQAIITSRACGLLSCSQSTTAR
jgi:hypothetical protein